MRAILKTMALAAPLMLLAVPAAAATEAQERDARCLYVKSTILGRLMEMPQEQQNPAVQAGVTSHVTYYFGRFSATLGSQAISDLVLAAALKVQSYDEVVAAEEACDQHMAQSLEVLTAVGDRLERNDR